MSHPLVFSPRPSRFFPRPYWERVVDRVVRHLREHGVDPERDVVFAHWLLPDGHIGVHVAQRLGLASVVEMQGDDVIVLPHKSAEHRRQVEWVLRNATSLVACSDFLGRVAGELAPHGRQVHTVYTGVDLDRFAPSTDPEAVRERRAELGFGPDDLVVLNVGTAIARKGWLELFAAAARLQPEFPTLRLLAVQAGAAEFDLTRAAADHGVDHLLTDLGEVQPGQMPGVFQAADVFCLPSHWEGLANALLEAMASGKPVVTTAVAGHPEVVIPGENGLLVPPGDVAALTDALRRMLSERGSWARYGSAARKAAERVGTTEFNSGRLKAVLQAAIESR